MPINLIEGSLKDHTLTSNLIFALKLLWRQQIDSMSR
jgi:hypothetical protein